MKRTINVVLALILALSLSSCSWNWGQWPWSENPAPQAVESPVQQWADEDGFAQVGNQESPRFVSWLEFHIEEEYSVNVRDHGSWYQAQLPSGLIVSWAEWGEEELVLADIDGLSEDKAFFVAKRDFSNWVTNPAATHYQCVGTFALYEPGLMSQWDVANATILQFDGDPLGFVENMVSAWRQVRKDWNGCPVQ